MKHKLGICIPYRNRKEHLEKLVPHLSNHLNNQKIDHTFYVGHQIDDKLFNRGTMKNIAAEHAFKDGCDYVAWHDVDMLPHNDCDYSYPEKNPIHIATKLSKYKYGLHYDQYFGGVVLFNKEHAIKTNGYSNDYWDWGQEDDDLFWRCYYENYTTGTVLSTYKNRKIANFDGETSYLLLPTNREISSCLDKEFTISILVSVEQQQDKVPIWLVGDKNRKFIEYPILRKDGSWNWGLSFNNSRAITMNIFDRSGNLHYNWGKRFENLWTWITMSYSIDKKGVYFYINKDLTCQINGNKQSVPFPINAQLKNHDAVKPFILGLCSSSGVFMKGKIAEVKIYNKFIPDINDVFIDNDDLVLHYDFNKSDRDLVNENFTCINNNVKFTKEKIELIDVIVPHRRTGTMHCLPHVDEGFVNGGWAKGETTARNEKRFVTEMQQGKIDYKNDGLNSLKYDLVNVDLFSDNCKMINVKL